MARFAIVLALLLAGASALAQPTLYEQAAKAEPDDMSAAVKLYVRAARQGDAKAARRLSEIYDKGIGGIARDAAESRKWDNAAQTLGERMQGDFPDRKRGY